MERVLESEVIPMLAMRRYLSLNKKNRYIEPFYFLGVATTNETQEVMALLKGVREKVCRVLFCLQVLHCGFSALLKCVLLFFVHFFCCFLLFIRLWEKMSFSFLKLLP